MFLCIQTYKFVKAEVADEEEEDANVDLCSKLLAFGVSLKQFAATLLQDDITM